MNRQIVRRKGPWMSSSSMMNAQRLESMYRRVAAAFGRVEAPPPLGRPVMAIATIDARVRTTKRAAESAQARNNVLHAPSGPALVSGPALAGVAFVWNTVVLLPAVRKHGGSRSAASSWA